MSTPGEVPEVNKFEQVSSDDHQMSLAGKGAPCLVRFHVWKGAGAMGVWSCPMRSDDWNRVEEGPVQ